MLQSRLFALFCLHGRLSRNHEKVKALRKPTPSHRTQPTAGGLMLREPSARERESPVRAGGSWGAGCWLQETDLGMSALLPGPGTWMQRRLEHHTTIKRADSIPSTW